MNATEYDNLIRLLEDALPTNWIQARSAEEAYAFQAWCAENGLEAPEVRLIKPQDIAVGKSR